MFKGVKVLFYIYDLDLHQQQWRMGLGGKKIIATINFTYV